MKKLMWTACAVLISGLLITGCTREAEKSSQIRFSVNDLINSKIGAQSVSADVSHIVVNVRGADLPAPIFWNWDGHKNGVTVAPPAYIQLDVPSGAGRLIQVLLVTKNATNAGMMFLYGDGKFDLLAGTQTVDIKILSSSNGTGEEAEVAGRYLTDGTLGPTGELELMYQPMLNGAPIPDRPMMKIMESSVINGWFNIFLVNGANFVYRFKHNSQPFLSTAAGGIAIGSSMFLPSQNVLHILKPAGWRWNSGSSAAEQVSPGRTILGFFGPGASPSTQAICYSSAGYVSDFYNSETIHSVGTQISYDPSPSDPPNFTGVTRLNNLGGIAYPTGGSLCNVSGGGTLFTDILNFDGTKIANGKIKSVGFQGIFKLQSPSDYQALTMTATGLNYSVSWAYVNTDVIGTNGVDGVAVMMHPNYDGDLSSDNDSIDCRSLLQRGFTQIESTLSANPSVAFTLPTTPAKLRIAACPYKDNYIYTGEARHFFPGVEYRSNSGGALGAFTIMGMTGGSDSIPDAWLGSSGSSTVNWATSSGASYYDVVIRDFADTTNICSQTNVSGNSYSFSGGCTLNENTSYKIKVFAKNSDGSYAQAATNNGFGFSVDSIQPTGFTITSVTCSTWGAGPYKQLSVVLSNSITDLNPRTYFVELFVDWGGFPNTNSNGDWNQTDPIQIGDASSNSSTLTTIRITATDLAGNKSEQIVPYSATSCPGSW